LVGPGRSAARAFDLKGLGHASEDDGEILGCPRIDPCSGPLDRPIWRKYCLCEYRPWGRWDPDSGWGHRDPSIGEGTSINAYGHIHSGIAYSTVFPAWEEPSVATRLLL